MRKIVFYRIYTYIISHNFEFFTSFLQNLKNFCKKEKVFEDSEINMKKEEFLKLLHAKLIERGIDKDTAEKETSHVRTYLTESGTEEINVSLDEMVDGIISMLDSGKDNKKPEKKPEAPAKATKAKTAEPEVKVKEEKPKKEKPKKEKAKPSDEKPKESEKKTKGSEKKDDAPTEEKRSLLYRMMAKVDKVIKHMQKVKEEKAAEKEKKRAEKEDREDDTDIIEYIPPLQKEKIQYGENGKMKNEWVYVAILVVAIPIAVALILLSVVLYLGFWIALALLMIACICVLVVFVTAGALVSIVGIVYGVVELITGNTPVALFEIGLGIIVGSIVMFIGILIYNFAVRFIPFGMKLLAKLFRLGFRALRSGYNMLKGAVSAI